MTVAELVEELLKFPQDALVLRVLTAEYGNTEIESVYLNDKGKVIID